MVINRVVEFKLLMELKFEQKRVLYCIPRVKRTRQASASVRPSDIFRYSRRNERDHACRSIDRKQKIYQYNPCGTVLEISYCTLSPYSTKK
jgi:hypothetical protein